mmetsp:Transcript_120381/g.275747  ORF Transcript_120381/g.275747 Transcript_120381/m.275747 type:complete len:422 (+) Transcript_120381:32-1297(+)
MGDAISACRGANPVITNGMLHCSACSAHRLGTDDIKVPSSMPPTHDDGRDHAMPVGGLQPKVANLPGRGQTAPVAPPSRPDEAGVVLIQSAMRRFLAKKHRDKLRAEPNTVEVKDKARAGGHRYTGQWADVLSVPHGEGSQVCADGSRRFGVWKRGFLHGKGSCVYPNGDTYEGQWQDGAAQGQGVFTKGDGSMTYSGGWSRNLMHGKGEEKWASGSYVGQFKAGHKSGFGTYTGTDGSSFEGQFQEGRRHGRGKFQWTDRRTYTGQWVDGQIHGMGCMAWPNGQEYRGGYVNSVKCGKGVHSWPDGRQYDGQWLHGKQHGIGKFQSTRGVVRVATWDAGKHGPWMTAEEAAKFADELDAPPGPPPDAPPPTRPPAPAEPAAATAAPGPPADEALESHRSAYTAGETTARTVGEPDILRDD